MHKVYKYPIKTHGRTILSLPEHSRIISASLQPKDETTLHLVVYALVNPNTVIEENHTIITVSTGEDIPTIALQALGTFINNGIVAHVFEVLY